MAAKPNEILVYVARHGTTEFNKSNQYRGHLDPDLDGQGWRDAHALAFYFEPIELGGIFFSTKKRSRHTAMLINKAKVDIPYVGHDNLEALDVGNLGGQKKTPETKKEVEYHAKNPDVPFEDGESFNEFRARVRPLFVDAAKLALRHGRPILVVSHSSVIREVGEFINGDHSSTAVEPGGVVAIFIEDGRLRVEPIFKPDKKLTPA